MRNAEIISCGRKGDHIVVLTKEQQEILNGSKGETMAKVLRTLVAYGEAFDAERLVPVTSEYGHTVISFGLGVMKPVYELYDRILSDNAISRQPFSADPRPLDKKNVPANNTPTNTAIINTIEIAFVLLDSTKLLLIE